MKRLAIISVLSTALAAPLAARAEPIQAVLTGFEEVPMVSTLATGEFRGVITHDDQFIDYEFAYRGLQGSVTQAHIHIAQKNVSGGIVVWLCGTGEPGTQFAGPEGTPPCTPGSGSFTGTIRADDVVVPPGSTGAQQITAGELGEVIAAMRAGAAYVNVHTSLSLPGEIRGQIRASRRP